MVRRRRRPGDQPRRCDQPTRGRHHPGHQLGTEQGRLEEAGISSRDWDSYPVLRFSQVPEVSVELVNLTADLLPLGVGEATAGRTAAAIGNAVARALGARLRDLPLTRERVMAALLSV